jgi:hypothetical protein
MAMRRFKMRIIGSNCRKMSHRIDLLTEKSSQIEAIGIA